MSAKNFCPTCQAWVYHYPNDCPNLEEESELSATTLLDRVNSWLETWSPNCGAPRAVFEGQFRVTLREIFDEIERRAEANMLKTGKLEGMHYAALKDVRRELSVTRSNDGADLQPRQKE